MDNSRNPINMQKYNSVDTPDNMFEVKRVINSINEMKRLNF